MPYAALGFPAWGHSAAEADRLVCQFATTHTGQRLTLWPLSRADASVVEAYDFSPNRKPLAFSPDSQWLAVGWEEGVRLMPVPGGNPVAVREFVLPANSSCSDIRFDPAGSLLFVVNLGDAWVVPLDGGPLRVVIPAVDNRQIERGAISPTGARVASAFFHGEGPFTLTVVDLPHGVTTTFDLPVPDDPQSGWPRGVSSLDFLDEQTLVHIIRVRDVREHTMDIHPQAVITKDNVEIMVDGVMWVRPTIEEDAIKRTFYNIHDWKRAIIQLAMNNLRQEFGDPNPG